MTKRKIKAVRAHVACEWKDGLRDHGRANLYRPDKRDLPPRVAVIPIDDEDALVWQTALAIAKAQGRSDAAARWSQNYWRGIAREALQLLGILPTPRKSKSTSSAQSAVKKERAHK